MSEEEELRAIRERKAQELMNMSKPEGGKGPIEINDQNLQQVIEGNSKLVIDCWAPWCGPCRMLTPVLEQLATEMNDVTFAKLNTDENPQAAMAFNIMSIPTLLFFKDGNMVERTVGALPKSVVQDTINKSLV